MFMYKINRDNRFLTSPIIINRRVTPFSPIANTRIGLGDANRNNIWTGQLELFLVSQFCPLYCEQPTNLSNKMFIDLLDFVGLRFRQGLT